MLGNKEELRKQLIELSPVGVKGVHAFNLDDLVGFILNREIKLMLTIAAERSKVEQLRTVEKAYGGCHKCYGKGYATVKSQITGYGTDGDIGGYEGPYKRDTPVQMNFCDCDRGKQLERLLHPTTKESK